MPANDNALDPQDGLISAAHAAASWVRARRTQWTSAPLTVLASPELETVPSPDDPTAWEPPPTFVPAPSVSAPGRQPPPSAQPPQPAVAPAVADVRPAAVVPHTGEPSAALRWLVRAGAAAAIVALAVVGGRTIWSALPSLPERSAPAAAAKPAAAAASRKATGSLHVTTTPPGARVLVDGKPRGVTPLDLADLRPGNHEIALQSDAGTVKRTVTVAANADATIDEAIFSGFVTVYAPFDVTVAEGGRVLRPDDRQQIMLSAGTHELRVSNRALGYEVVRRVDVQPGEATNLQLTPEPSALTVTAAQTTEVFLDGTRLGETPLNAAPVPLGVHEILVRRASGGERRFTVTIGAKPFTLNVDF